MWCDVRTREMEADVNIVTPCVTSYARPGGGGGRGPCCGFCQDVTGKRQMRVKR